MSPKGIFFWMLSHGRLNHYCCKGAAESLTFFISDKMAGFIFKFVEFPIFVPFYGEFYPVEYFHLSFHCRDAAKNLHLTCIVTKSKKTWCLVVRTELEGLILPICQNSHIFQKWKLKVEYFNLYFKGIRMKYKTEIECHMPIRVARVRLFPDSSKFSFYFDCL